MLVCLVGATVGKRDGRLLVVVWGVVAEGTLLGEDGGDGRLLIVIWGVVAKEVMPGVDEDVVGAAARESLLEIGN
jgi:hypothetical protein